MSAEREREPRYLAVADVRAGVDRWLSMYEATADSLERIGASELCWALGFLSGLESPLAGALTPELRQRFAALRDRVSVEIELRLSAERERGGGA